MRGRRLAPDHGGENGGAGCRGPAGDGRGGAEAVLQRGEHVLIGRIVADAEDEIDAARVGVELPREEGKRSVVEAKEGEVTR